MGAESSLTGLADVAPGQLKSELKFLLVALRWIGGAAGLGTIVGAIGWYIEISQNELLGIRSEISSNFVTTYLLNFVRFILDCLHALLELHPLSLAVAVLLVIATILLGSRFRSKVDLWARHHPVMLASMALGSLACWTTYFAAPTFLFTNTLFDGNPGVGRVFDVSYIPRTVANQTWKEIVCSHNHGAPTCGSYYEGRRQARFACGLMLLAFLWAASAIFVWPRGQSTFVPEGLRALILVGLIGATLLIPFIYGKTILSTTFPSATITFEAYTQESKLSQDATIGNFFYKIVESIPLRRARTNEAAKKAGQPVRRFQEIIPSNTEELLALLKDLYPWRTQWDSFALNQLVPDEVRGKKIGFAQEQYLNPLRVGIAHALLKTGEIRITLDKLENIQQVNKWLPLCRVLARMLLRHEFPAEFGLTMEPLVIGQMASMARAAFKFRYNFTVKGGDVKVFRDGQPVDVSFSTRDKDTADKASPLHRFLESIGQSRVNAHIVCEVIESGKSVESVMGDK
jgi:hypothetical protein